MSIPSYSRSVLIPEELAKEFIRDGYAVPARVKRSGATEWIVTASAAVPVAIQLLQGPQVIDYYREKFAEFVLSRRTDEVVLIRAQGPKGSISVRLNEPIPVDPLMDAIRYVVDRE